MKQKRTHPKTVEEKGAGLEKRLAIEAPNFRIIVLEIEGDAPLVMHAMSEKVRKKLRESHEAGSQTTTGQTKDPRKFHEEYEGAKHRSREGWVGFPAPAIRNACISACRVVGFKMTLAKLSIFALSDGFDRVDGTPLIRIYGEEHEVEHAVRLARGDLSLVHRPMWNEGWTAKVRIRYDADLFKAQDVINLLHRVGAQVGIMEGRPDSRMSGGMGWGTFIVREHVKVERAA